MLSAGISVSKSSLSTNEVQNYTCYIPARYSLKPSLFSSYLCLGLFRQRFALQQTINYSLAQYPARSRSESEENVVEGSSRARTQGRELGGGKFQRMYEVPDEEERGDKSTGGGVGRTCTANSTAASQTQGGCHRRPFRLKSVCTKCSPVAVVWSARR